MRKLKTHKATKKRFKLSATGKVRHWKKGNNGHLRSKKSNRRKGRLSGTTELKNKSELKRVTRLLKG